MNKLLRNCVGSVMVEFTLVFPMVLLVTLGTVDVTYMLYDWALASKAAYVGARTAVVSNPVATGITDLTWNNVQLGGACFDSGSGMANGNCVCRNGDGSTNTNCVVSKVCSGTGANCSGFSSAAFATIFDKMQAIFPRLQPQNVQISYQTNGLGFAGRPDGLPMNVTVSIKCMTHQFYFIGALMGWAFSPPAGCDPAPPAGLSIPAFATTLTSEDMATN